MAKNTLSRDQKRKKQLAERKKANSNKREAESYRTRKYVMITLTTEQGIYESDVILQRQLTDQEVVSAIHLLTTELRANSAPLLHPPEEFTFDTQDPGPLIVANVKRHWATFFTSHPQISNVDLEGILRSILLSIRERTTALPNSRGYLNFLDHFLGDLGIKMSKVGSGEDEENFEDEEMDELHVQRV